MKTLGKVVVVLGLIAMPLVSCDPEEIVDGVEVVPEELVDSLENVLFRQARAMQSVVTEEDVQVVSCVQADVEGFYEISLTSNVSFRIPVGELANDYETILSYQKEGEQTYWTVADGKGGYSALLDSDGDKVAVASEIDIKVDGRELVLMSGDRACKLGRDVEAKVKMFECSPLEDAAGNVYAVLFDFGENNAKIVYVAEYAGVYFYLPSDESKTAIAEMYAPYGGKTTLGLTAFDGLDYEIVTPEGWTSSVSGSEGKTLVVLTAPQKASGEEETIELIVRSADASYVFSTINLIDEPFRSVSVSATSAVVVPTTGIGKFAYGISTVLDFDEEKVKSMASGLVAGSQTPSAGNAVSDVAVSPAFSELLGSSLSPISRYVLWAFADNRLVCKEFGEISVNLDIVSPYLLDADVKVSVNGAEALFYGVAEKTENTMTDILYQVQNRIHEPLAVSQSYSYEGKASAFTLGEGGKNEIYPETRYVLWVVPAVDGDYVYSEDDIFSTELVTNSIVAGGSLELTCGEAKVTPSSISFSLSCDGAAMIYYAYLNATGGDRYAADAATNAMRFEQIISEDSDFRVGPVQKVIGNSVEAIGKNFNDEAATKYWLYAVAVDSEGRYGKVHCVSAQTLALAYDNSIQLTVDANNITSSSATFKVTSVGGDLSDYIYWVGRVTDPFWANTSYCAATRSGAQKYMALNPEDENITSAMRKYGKLSADGTLTVSDMTMETKYVFVILEKGDVYYSPIGYKLVTTLAANLGEIVREGSDEWNQAKASVKLEWNRNKFEPAANSAMMATYGFTFSCPDNLTAYVMCASENYFKDAGLTRTEHIMIEIENYASRRYANNRTPIINGDLVTEPDYYKDGVLKQGQLMNVYEFCVHGVPSLGFVTYFAKGSHGVKECLYWENGQCSEYQSCMESIAKFNSLAPWEERAAMFGLTGKEASDWSQALLEAYSVYYKDAKPIIYENDGNGVEIITPYATGVNEEGVIPDRVVVMFKDLQGNYYEPMFFEVPNYFE